MAHNIYLRIIGVDRHGSLSYFATVTNSQGQWFAKPNTPEHATPEQARQWAEQRISEVFLPTCNFIWLS